MKNVLRKHGESLGRKLSALCESGQSVVIYVLILTVIAVASAGALHSLKNNVNTTMDHAEQRIANTNIGSDESYIAVEVLQHMTVTAEDYTGGYDGNSHTGTVTVSVPGSGYSIRYGTAAGSYTSSTAPAYSDPGSWTVYFKVTADGYHSYEGHLAVTINPRYVSIPSAYGSFTYDGTTKTATIDGYDSTYCTRSGTTSAVNAGTYTVTFTLKNDTFMKGLWAKIPADGKTTVTKPTLMGQDEAGKNIWQDVKTDVPNRDLKAMVESYKTRAPQEKATEHRESAREKLDALVKDTAAKVSIDKPKAKTKAKKGPEL